MKQPENLLGPKGQLEDLSITNGQIRKFIGLCRNLSGKCVKVMIDGVETTFTSNMSGGEARIHIESDSSNITLVLRGNVIEKFYLETSYGTFTKGNSGSLDRESLEKDLDFLSNSLNSNSTRSRLSKVGGRLKNVLNG